MKLLRGFEDPSCYRGGFVSIGNFDGVHRGHQSMIAALVRHAQSDGVPAVVFTFDPHPIKLLRPEHAPPSLSTLQRKAELIERLGVDCIIAYPTDHDLLNLTPGQFFDQIVLGELQARGLAEGPNFFFGHDRAGNVDTLRKMCDSHGLILDVVEPTKVGERLVSSSVVRGLIAAGNVAEAVDLLGHPYQIRGVVGRGAGRGRSLGFPTANLERVETLLPAEGVYAGSAHHDENTFPAAINLGSNPTFGDMASKVEVHLIGFDGDLYGEELKVNFLDRLRDTREFDGPDDLKEQVQRDIDEATKIARR